MCFKAFKGRTCFQFQHVSVQVFRGQRSGVPSQVTDEGDVVRGVSHAGQGLVGGDLLVAGQRNHLLHLHTHKAVG